MPGKNKLMNKIRTACPTDNLPRTGTVVCKFMSRMRCKQLQSHLFLFIGVSNNDDDEIGKMI